jgi:hypothetical protein
MTMTTGKAKAAVPAAAAIIDRRIPAMPPLRFRDILQDAALIFLLTLLGGIVVLSLGSGAGMEKLLPVAGVANLLLATIGFCISGCRHPLRRWPHLLAVAGAVWLLSGLQLLIMPLPPVLWLANSVTILLFMALGGGLSLLLVPNRTPPTDPP